MEGRTASPSPRDCRTGSLRARCVVGIAPFDAADLDWLRAAWTPRTSRSSAGSPKARTVLTAELAREAAEELARVAEDPATLFGEFDLPVADRAVLQHPLMQQIIRETTAEAHAQGVGGWVDDDFAAVRPWGFDVAEIRVPTEVWYGEADVLVPAAHGRWLADHILGAEVHVERNDGHLTDPDIELERTSHLRHRRRGRRLTTHTRQSQAALRAGRAVRCGWSGATVGRGDLRLQLGSELGGVHANQPLVLPPRRPRIEKRLDPAAGRAAQRRQVETRQGPIGEPTHPRVVRGTLHDRGGDLSPVV